MFVAFAMCLLDIDYSNYRLHIPVGHCYSFKLCLNVFNQVDPRELGSQYFQKLMLPESWNLPLLVSYDTPHEDSIFIIVLLIFRFSLVTDVSLLTVIPVIFFPLLLIF